MQNHDDQRPPVQGIEAFAEWIARSYRTDLPEVINLDELIPKLDYDLTENFFVPIEPGEIREGHLIHFTNHEAAEEILRSGFVGTSDHRRLAQTMGGRKVRKDGGTERGFNFGYSFDDPEQFVKDRIHCGHPYGSVALVFPARHVRCWHRISREVEAIFWGPDVDPGSILVLRDVHDDTQVKTPIEQRKTWHRGLIVTQEPMTAFDAFRDIVAELSTTQKNRNAPGYLGLPRLD